MRTAVGFDPVEHTAPAAAEHTAAAVRIAAAENSLVGIQQTAVADTVAPAAALRR